MVEIAIQNLRIAFPAARGMIEAVKGISFTVGQERIGLVGESGSGKSLTARSILKLLPAQARLNADRLTFDGMDVLAASEKEMRRIRGKRAGLIMQDPKFSLNPVITIGAQVAEAWRAHRGDSRRVAYEAAVDLLAQVQIRDPRRVAAAYPHELSGGMGQRAMIAMMLAPEPEMLIADEPTSALDATIQQEILRLIEDLVTRRGLGLILISHDLPLVSHVCDRVLVMYAGRIVENIRASRLNQATHPYTRGLINCLPSLKHPKARLNTMEREPAWLR